MRGHNPKSLAERLDGAGALIRRKKGTASSWFHEHVPGEGSGIKCIRVTGLFVHGEEEEADKPEAGKPEADKQDEADKPEADKQAA